MTKVVYEIVEHDGGWAYRVDGVTRAAVRAAKEQVVPVETTDDIPRGQRRALARRSFERHRSARAGHRLRSAPHRSRSSS
jgi:hypothetical protein